MSSLLGILGNPVRHSLSPAMQNAALQHLKLPYLYLPWQVTSHDLGPFVRKLRTWKLRGFNVTIPHKEGILRYLDKVDPIAQAMGAVNTVVCTRGKWIGYNTDGAGYLRSLQQETHFNPRHKEVLLLGAGGAARGVAFALLQGGCVRLTIANRTLAHAERLIQSLKKSFPKAPLEIIPWADLPHLGQMNLGFVPDLLVNATSITPNFLPKARLVSDLVYRPRLTLLLKQARRRGMKIHEGWSMLLHQGALAFQLWTGKPAPIKVMKRVLLAQLKT